MVGHWGKHARYEIVEAIRRVEESTRGEIRVHVKPGGSKEPMKEAVKVFRRLGMHRTKERNAVLIFVAPKNRCFAIVGDEGIHRKVGDDFWNGTRDVMSGLFTQGDIVGGIVAAVRSAGDKLKVHFPASSNNPDELSDAVSEG